MSGGIKIDIKDKEFQAVLRDAKKEIDGTKRAKFYKEFRDYMFRDLDRRFDVRGVDERGKEKAWPKLAKPDRKNAKRGDFRKKRHLC